MIFRRKKSPAPPPVSTPPPAAPASDVALREPGSPRKKILVVDDDPVIRQTLSLKLKSKGYDVVTASEGAEAISAVRDEKPDLMLMDICFPPDVASGGNVPWDGFTLTQWLRHVGGAAKIPTILMSGVEQANY